VTAWHGETARTLLFDTGPESAVFEQNVESLGFDMGSVAGIVLSHGHWDHCGAMLRALQMIRQCNGGRDVPTYMHPGMYRTRATKAADGTFRLFEDVPSAAALEQHGAEVIHSTRPQVAAPTLFSHDNRHEETNTVLNLFGERCHTSVRRTLTSAPLGLSSRGLGNLQIL